MNARWAASLLFLDLTPASAQELVRDSIPGTLVTFELVRIPAGSVTLRSPVGDRAVAVPEFLIGRTELTWNAYDTFFLSAPGPNDVRADDAVARPSKPYGAPDYGWGHSGFPAMSLARPAAEAFCVWLSARTGKRYRLPTDTEWQYVAQLATRGERRNPEPEAWHAGNAGGRTHAVATRAPDALGLYDLFGNVAEWVMTDSGGPVTRGGSYRDSPSVPGPNARATQDDSWNERDPQIPKSRWWLSDGPFVGFRILRDP